PSRRAPKARFCASSTRYGALLRMRAKRGTSMSNTIDLANRFAVVTGGAQGIGRAITERILDSGAAVAIWDRDKAFAEKTARELANRGQTLAVACEVTRLADVGRARDDTVNDAVRIEILVNNAGIP